MKSSDGDHERLMAMAREKATEEGFVRVGFRGLRDEKSKQPFYFIQKRLGALQEKLYRSPFFVCVCAWRHSGSLCYMGLSPLLGQPVHGSHRIYKYKPPSLEK